MKKIVDLPLVQLFVAAVLFFAVITICFVLKLQDILSVILGTPLLLGALIPRKATFQLLFYYFCISLLVGQRSVYITPIIRVYPQEIIILVLAFLLMVYKKRIDLPPQLGKIPWSAKVFAGLSVFAIYTAYETVGSGVTVLSYYDKPSALDLGIYYTKGFLVFLPLFYCVYRLVHTRRQLANTCCVLMVVALLVSINSVAERYGFGLVHVLEEQTEAMASKEEATGFLRSATSWGGPMLSASLCLMFMLMYGLRSQYSGIALSKIALMTQAFCFAFIVFAGHRGNWLAFILMNFIYHWIRGNAKILFICLLCMTAVVVIPNSAMQRFKGLYGEQKDSSTEDRLSRMAFAQKLISERPYLGYGWGAAGLAHTDLLQIAADAGCLTLGAFLLFYAVILKRLYRFIKFPREDPLGTYGTALFCGLLGYLIIFAVQSQLNIQEVFIIFWLFLALGGALPGIASREKIA